ncbi:glycine--tRNA ligase subunit beta [Candidatus Legionella polyplacis]|uniref:glycine--tRNA ligase subunit beta n=1 Tax=Candidatus Legionella polyplacis TaxID=2005262 RepID=UPI000C1E1247|nr:glycine--tRNA ligase subunit beta [Candidatus Legionella polyplacis]ATW02035.1 glycine--tRNA ligase subunit beta [Candidatus Legionella polyplacis]
MGVDFLFELGCEELPSKELLVFSEIFFKKILDGMKSFNILYEDKEIFLSSRRIAICIENIKVEKKVINNSLLRFGPLYSLSYDKLGNPTDILLNFIKNNDLSLKDIIISYHNDKKYVAYYTFLNKKKLKNLLSELISKSFFSLSFFKFMRWNLSNVMFIRPVRWLVCLLGKDIIDFMIYGLKSERITYGNKFFMKSKIYIDNPSLYKELLNKYYVIPNFFIRKKYVLDEIKKIEKNHNVHVIFSENLINEVISMVEWPRVLLGRFSKKFLTLPKEVIIEVLEVHQRCFALQDSQFCLIPYFIIVTNIVSNNFDKVIKDNEKSVYFKLNDANLFFNEDKKYSLISRYKDLNNIIFQEKLGSMKEKIYRIKCIIKTALVNPLSLNIDDVIRAIKLSKCDLLTEMVCAFPKLQGFIGYYYAIYNKEKMSVAIALKEQYFPRFSNDILPMSRIGIALSLADCLDTFVGIFLKYGEPKKSKDPFKLRRYALSLVRLLLNISYPFNLSFLINLAYDNYIRYNFIDFDNINIINKINDFVFDRFKYYHYKNGVNKSLLKSVFVSGKYCFYEINNKIEILKYFFDFKKECSFLISVCKRINNCLFKMPKIKFDNFVINESFFNSNFEFSLFRFLTFFEKKIKGFIYNKKCELLLKYLIELGKLLNNLLNHVRIVNNNNIIYLNRLALIKKSQKLFFEVSDFSLLELDKI